MSDDAPEREDESLEDGPDYRHDALSELMTGAYAATSMVSMSVSGDANLPAPPAWSPTADAPKAESLDRASGLPAQLDSGPHPSIEDEIHIELDDVGLPDVVAMRANAITVPLAGARKVPPPPVDVIPTDPDDDDDELEPAAAISTDSGVIVTPKHALGARLTGAYTTLPAHLRSPAPRERGKTPWIVAGVAAAVVIGIGAAFMMSPTEATPSEAADVADAADATEAAEALIVEPPAAADAAPKETAVPDLADQPELPEFDEPEPDNDGSGRASESPSGAYARATKRYAQDGSNEALLDMTLAACELHEGPDARAAFRKLVGSKPRSTAVIECREHGVDVSADVLGYTAAELADRAQAAFDAGELKRALDLAKESNKTERNQAALGLIVRAHCHAKDRSAATKMMRHIGKKHRRAIIKECAQHGVRLR